MTDPTCEDVRHFEPLALACLLNLPTLSNIAFLLVKFHAILLRLRARKLVPARCLRKIICRCSRRKSRGWRNPSGYMMNFLISLNSSSKSFPSPSLHFLKNACLGLFLLAGRVLEQSNHKDTYLAVPAIICDGMERLKMPYSRPNWRACCMPPTLVLTLLPLAPESEPVGAVSFSFSDPMSMSSSSLLLPLVSESEPVGASLSFSDPESMSSSPLSLSLGGL